MGWRPGERSLRVAEQGKNITHFLLAFYFLKTKKLKDHETEKQVLKVSYRLRVCAMAVCDRIHFVGGDRPLHCESLAAVGRFAGSDDPRQCWCDTLLNHGVGILANVARIVVVHLLVPDALLLELVRGEPCREPIPTHRRHPPGQHAPSLPRRVAVHRHSRHASRYALCRLQICVNAFA